MDPDAPPKEAETIQQLLELVQNEKKRIRYTLYQPHLVTEMKSNVIKLSDTLKHSINKTAMLMDQKEAINELCKEISKHISILTISVKIINYGLCESAANELIKTAINVFHSIHKLFTFIHKNQSNTMNDDTKNDDNDPNEPTLTTLVGVVWEQLKQLKTIPLNNTTSIGRNIMSTLSVIRDAKKEIKQSIKEMENNECIIRLNPWNYDYSKLESMQKDAMTQRDDDDDAKDMENNDNDDDDDFLFLGMDESERTELESLRVYQIYELIVFVDEVINHIYLFIIKHFKENINDLNAQKQWLTNLTESIACLPNYVDEISCCIYSRPCDDEICKNASNLLHFLWQVAIEIAEESVQYKCRKMVIKNKKKKSKTSMTGNEWKCKFINYNIKIGQMFGLLCMEHIDKYIANDVNYKKENGKKQEKTKHKKHQRKDKIRKLKKKKKRKDNDVVVSASSQKEPEDISSQANTNEIEKEITSDQEYSDDMIDID